MAVNVQLLGLDNAIQTAANVLRQMPYATANAMTRTAREAVEAGRKEIGEHFVIRKAWILGRMKIISYPRQGNLTTVLGIDPRVQGAKLLLGFFEEGEGGTKSPSHGSGIAIPLTGGPARPSFIASVVTAFRYLNLRLFDRKGRKQTYVVPGVGVFERVGPGGRVWDASRKKMVTVDRSRTPLVYLYKPSAPLTTRMKLRQAIARTWAARFSQIFSEEFAREVMARSEHIAAKLR